MVYGSSGASPGSLPKTERQKNSYPHHDTQGRFTWDNLIRRPPGDNRVDVPTMFYPIFVKQDDTIRIPDMTWDESTRSYNILEKPLLFSNRITYGKDSTEGFVDILETYCYLKGFPIQRRLRFDFGDQVYRVIQSGKRAVVFRKVTEADDTPQLLEILADERLAGVTQLDVNYDVDQNELLAGSDVRQIHLITTSDFDTGAMWDTVET